MRRNMFRRAVVTVLVASLGLSQPVASLAMEGNTTSVLEEVAENDGIDEALSVTGSSDGEENLTNNIPEPGLKGDVFKVNKPRTDDGVSTWDCIWFGRYWQEDTNGDGHCFSEDTVVTKHDDGNYYDQDGKRLNNYSGEEGTYYHDEKQPIKWRVLDIDESGNALLLSDKLIDIVQYNEKFKSVTWEKSTIRSYLNSYGAYANKCKKDYSLSGFLNNAFSSTEQAAIAVTAVQNPDNPVYETNGGKDTADKVFCLSLDESMTGNYGFVKNAFNHGGNPPYYTDADRTRMASTTKYTDDKPGYDSGTDKSAGWWWLRSPGNVNKDASRINSVGSVHANFDRVDFVGNCVRPDIRLKISLFPTLWSYAGTVSSDGTVEEVDPPVPQDERVSEFDVDEDDRNVSMIPGEVRRLQLNKTGKYLYGVKWSVSFSDTGDRCVSVKNGVITANVPRKRNVGNATVTAEYCGETVDFFVTVDGTPHYNVPIQGEKGKYAISAPKTVTMTVSSNKVVSIGIPKQLRNDRYTLSCSILRKGVIGDEPVIDRSAGSKAQATLEAMEAGATYVVWSMEDESGTTQAFTKIIVRKPVSSITIAGKEAGFYLKPGEGKRLIVTDTMGNTDPKDISFSVTGKGVSVSKSGYVVATLPGSEAKVTVKSGEASDSVNVKVSDSSKTYLSINKTSVSVSVPNAKVTKPKKIPLKLSVPRKKSDRPEVEWGIVGNHAGITIDWRSGQISVGRNASPGCYSVTASADGYDAAYCEIILR